MSNAEFQFQNNLYHKKYSLKIQTALSLTLIKMKYRLLEYSFATNNKSKKSIHIVQLFFDTYNKHSLIYPNARTKIRKSENI